MKNNTKNKVFLFLNFYKFIIVVLNEKDEVIYKKKITIENSTNKIELNIFSEFLNQNIRTKWFCAIKSSTNN